MAEPLRNHAMDDFEAHVQAAQQAYTQTMARHWEQVVAGELAEADYWRIADGALLARCKARIRDAITEYDLALARMRRAAPAGWD